MENQNYDFTSFVIKYLLYEVYVGSQLFPLLARRSQDIRKMLNPDSRSLMGKLGYFTHCIFCCFIAVYYELFFISFFYFVSYFLSCVHIYSFSFSLFLFFLFQENPVGMQVFCSMLFWLSKYPLLCN